MVGQRGWILVIGLLVFLTDGGECISGQACCKEDWDKLMAPFLKAYKEYAADVNSTAFKASMLTWMDNENKYSHDELKDLCEGDIAQKCEAEEMKNATCKCNNDVGYELKVQRSGTHPLCEAKKVGVMCIDDPRVKNPCGRGMKCHTSFGSPTGECLFSGDNGPGRREKLGYEKGMIDEKGGSYTPRPIMWVIIGGLVIIPPASS